MLLEPLLVRVCEWGRVQGCTRKSFVGRLGWARSWARSHGFTVEGVAMEGEL